jgi:hypothetical protein
MKRQLVEAGGWWANFWENAFNNANTVLVFNDLIEKAKDYGINTDDLMRDVTVSGNINPTAFQIEKYQPEINALAEQVKAMEAANEMRKRGTNANYENAASLAHLYAKTVELTDAQKAVNDVVSIKSNYKSIIDLAYAYSDTLKEIDEKKLERDKLIKAGWWDQGKAVKALDADIEELEQSMSDMANQMTLDMFQATIAIGGVTTGELQAYMDMAIGMGLMSEEGAQAAIDAYTTALDTINGMKLDDKTSNINMDASQVWETFNLIDQMMLARQNGTIDLWVKYHNTGVGWDDTYEAAGGNVNQGHPYMWQEYGYRGERFVPSRDGYVLSRSDAARAVSEGKAKKEDKDENKSGITINVSELVVREDADIERIAVELYRRMR